MKNCSVPTCKNRWITGGLNKKYHAFPKDPLLRAQWAQAIGMTRSPANHSGVCSDHFKFSDYTVTNYGNSYHGIRLNV